MQYLKKLSSAAFFAFALSAAPLNAATYYVAPYGQYTNNGSKYSPWDIPRLNDTTLQPGDTVYFRGGTYSVGETVKVVNSGTASDWIVLAAYPGETPVLDATNILVTGDDAVVLISDSDYIKIDGLHVVNSPMQGIVAYISSHIIIQNCYTDLTWKSGIAVWGDKMLQDISQYVYVYDNEVSRPTRRSRSAG